MWATLDAWDRRAAFWGLEREKAAIGAVDCWQYMGSVFRLDDNKWSHEFRHREHPTLGGRVNLVVTEEDRTMTAGRKKT